jgi:hypothetical protein
MENFPKKSECREDDLQDYKITRPKLTYFIRLANIPVRCNEKNTKHSCKKDNVNGTYLLMFYTFIIYFMMTITSIT